MVQVSKGLLEKFGEDRVIDTPITEMGTQCSTTSRASGGGVLLSANTLVVCVCVVQASLAWVWELP